MDLWWNYYQTKGESLRHGKRISVRATAAERRKGSMSRAKARVIPGKPVKLARNDEKIDASSRYHLPIRRPLKGRLPHSLKANIDKGSQNAGKW